MAERVMDLVEKIAEARGLDYAKGMVDMANILTQKNNEAQEKAESKEGKR